MDISNAQPEALRLANLLVDWTKDYATTDFDCDMGDQAAAALRRLHAENEALREANERFGQRQDWWDRRMGELEDKLKADESLLRQALDTLSYWLEHGETPGAHDMIQRTHDALQERLIPRGVGKMVGKREHITDGRPCWCNPETTYTDPDTGVSVIVHKEPQ